MRSLKGFNLFVFICVLISFTGLVSPRFAVPGDFDWPGSFDNTSVERDADSGDLGIGYGNGSVNDNITAFWRFDEVNGGLSDYSGLGNDGSTNGVTLEDGIFSTSSYDFSTGSYVSVPDSPDLNPSDFTLSAWINASDISGTHPIIQKTTSNDRGYELMIDNYYSVPRLTLRIQSSADGEQEPRTEAGVTANEWVHVAATYNDTSGEVRLYINGENQSLYDGTYADLPPYSYDKDDSELVLGSSSASTSGDFFIGDMDEVRIYNRTLDQEEIRGLTFNNSGVFQGSYSRSFDLTDFERPSNVSLDVENTGSINYNSTIEVSSGGESDSKTLLDGFNTYSFDTGYSGGAEIDVSLNSSDPAVTPVISNYTLFTETTSFFVNLDRPENDFTYSGGVPLDVYSNRDVDNWFYSLDQEENVSFTPNTTLDISDGEHDLVVWANSSGEFENDTVNFSVDTTPPTFRNFQDDTGNSFTQIDTAEISLELRDDVSGLEEAVLSTNETGRFVNKSQVYDSPQLFNSISNSWVDTVFGWSNTSFSGNLGYRIWYRDRLDNWGSTSVESFQVEESNTSTIFQLQNFRQMSSDTFNFTTPDSVGKSGQKGNLRLGYENGSSTDNLNAFWRFDYNYQDVYRDYSGNGNNGSLVNVGRMDGVFSTSAAEFSSSEEAYVEIPHDASLSPENFTISGWIKPSFTGQNMPIIQKTTGTDRGYDFLVDNYFNENRLGLILQSGTDGRQRYRTSTSLEKNVWQHVAVTYNSFAVTFYINGEKASKTGSASTASRDISDQDMVIGASSVSSGGNYYNGGLDELRIFDQELSDQQIKEHYLNSSGTKFNGSYMYNYSLNDQEVPDLLQVNSENIQDNFANVTIETEGKNQKINLDGSDIYSGLDFQNDEGKLQLSLNLGTENVSSSPVINSLGLLTSDQVANIRSNVNFNDSSPVEGEEVKTSFNFTNLGNRGISNTSLNFSIERFNGTEWIKIIGSQVYREIGGRETTFINKTFEAVPGPYRINSTADYRNKIAESSENDNDVRKILNISSYQIIYGDRNFQKVLGHGSEELMPWDVETETVIYYNDIDSEFSPENIFPIKNMSDVSKADQKLKLRGHKDSLQNLYDQNQDGNIDETVCWNVLGDRACKIPVINSTNTSSFKTALFYISTSEGFNLNDEIVMATKTNESGQGLYGNYDYEVKLPYTLGRQKGSKDAVSLYYEIN